jgi:adenine/guanine/hypoxanthine permease
MNYVSSLFRLQENKTSVGTEVRAGTASFLAMSYIIFANPAILSVAGIPFQDAVVATCLCAGIMTILMGLATNYPMCMAAGMGLNAVIAFTIVKGMGFTWQAAMGMVVLEGLAVLVLSLTSFRRSVMEAIPVSLKHAIAVGIGLFITFIGLQGGNFIKAHTVTLVTFEDFNNPSTVLSALGLSVTSILLIKQIKGAFLIGICITIVAGMLPVWPLREGMGLPGLADGLPARTGALIAIPNKVFEVPRGVPTFAQFDIKEALNWAMLPVGFAFLISDFFDTIGTSVAVGTKAGFMDESGRIPRLRRLLIVDSLGAVAGGMFGCSSNTCYIESAAGVSEGGRTGLTSVVCGLLFVLAIFLAPLAAVAGAGIQISPGVVKYPVTSAALILVGFMMMGSLRQISWDVPHEALPAFLIIVGIPFSFSITHGIALGFVAYTLFAVVSGRAKAVPPLMWICTAMFLLVFLLPVFSK